MKNTYNISGNSISFEGELTKFTVPDYFSSLKKNKKTCIEVIDLALITSIDSAGVAFLDFVIEFFSTNESKIEVMNVSPSVTLSIKTFSEKKIINKISVPVKDGVFAEIGDKFFKTKDAFISGLFLTSDILYWSVVGIFNKKGQRKGTLVQQSLLIGVDALPIVGLLSLILGLILALQSAAQLKQFGANIFVADLIAVSMLREMGPMMTAIIVAGRSGSSIASEIATMKVTEELDALKMMAINPLRYIVVPKFHAITICMPLLVTMSIVIGIFGGLIVGVTYLELSVTSFITECLLVVELKDVIISLIKSIFFSWLIVIIGSYYGFNVQGGAEGVGKATTLSVVASIFAVIVADALFSLIYMI